MARKNRDSLGIFWSIISPSNFGPPQLLIPLFICTFGAFLTCHFLSLSRNGDFELSKQRWLIMIICGSVIEVLNQVTYWYAKKNYNAAQIFKGAVFWCVFTIAISAYIFLLIGLPPTENANWNWFRQIGPMLAYLLLSWFIPIYSIIPDIRFLLLYGRYGR